MPRITIYPKDVSRGPTMIQGSWFKPLYDSADPQDHFFCFKGEDDGRIHFINPDVVHAIIEDHGIEPKAPVTRVPGDMR